MLRHMFVTLGIVAVIYSATLFAISNSDNSNAPVTEVSDVTTNEQSNPDKFTELTIEGLSAKVSLEDGSNSIGKLWEKFYQLESLHNNVNWHNGSDLYVVYSHFDATIMNAIMTIGYDYNDLLQDTEIPSYKIPAGDKEYVAIDQSSYIVDESAWITAASKGVLVEHWILNSNGDMQEIKAFVLELTSE